MINGALKCIKNSVYIQCIVCSGSRTMFSNPFFFTSVNQTSSQPIRVQEQLLQQRAGLRDLISDHTGVQCLGDVCLCGHQLKLLQSVYRHPASKSAFILNLCFENNSSQEIRVREKVSRNMRTSLFEVRVFEASQLLDNLQKRSNLAN